MRRMGEIAKAVPGVTNVVQFPGLNAVHFVATPNAGVMFVGLEEPGPRELEAGEIAMRINMGFGGIQEGLAFALLPPPVLGLGNANGLELYVEDRGGLGYGELYNQTMAFIGAVNSTEGFDPMATFTSYQSNVPQLDASVDRTKVKELGLSLTDVFNTLQVYLGSSGAPTRCTPRPIPGTGPASRTSRDSRSATPAARWCRSAAWSTSTRATGPTRSSASTPTPRPTCPRASTRPCSPPPTRSRSCARWPTRCCRAG
jgi:hypothetical protein